MQGTRFDSWVGKIPWRRKWQPTPVFLPGKSHGQRSLMGYNPWGHKESDITEQLTFHWINWSLKRSFFFNERKKTTQQRKLPFQQSGARVYFLVFPFPEEHSVLTLQTSWQIAQEMFRLLRCVFSLFKPNPSVYIIRWVCLLGIREIIKLCPQMKYIWPWFGLGFII